MLSVSECHCQFCWTFSYSFDFLFCMANLVILEAESVWSTRKLSEYLVSSVHILYKLFIWLVEYTRRYGFLKSVIPQFTDMGRKIALLIAFFLCKIFGAEN